MMNKDRALDLLAKIIIRLFLAGSLLFIILLLHFLWLQSPIFVTTIVTICVLFAAVMWAAIRIDDRRDGKDHGK